MQDHKESIIPPCAFCVMDTVCEIIETFIAPELKTKIAMFSFFFVFICMLNVSVTITLCTTCGQSDA